jgi:hypothetical protein
LLALQVRFERIEARRTICDSLLFRHTSNLRLMDSIRAQLRWNLPREMQQRLDRERLPAGTAQ